MDDTTQPVDSDLANPTPAAPALPARLTEQKMMAIVGSDAAGSLVGALEVMVQEGIKVFSFPASLVEKMDELAAVFGPRATFAVHDVDETGIEAALASSAEVVALREPSADLVSRTKEAGKSVLVPALTPTEVQQASALGADAVVVIPAEVMGASYPEGLMPLVPGVCVGARGGLGAYSARRWVEAGASFVCLDAALVGDALTGGSLSGLRERCQTFVTSVS